MAQGARGGKLPPEHVRLHRVRTRPRHGLKVVRQWRLLQTPLNLSCTPELCKRCKDRATTEIQAAQSHTEVKPEIMADRIHLDPRLYASSSSRATHVNVQRCAKCELPLTTELLQRFGCGIELFLFRRTCIAECNGELLLHTAKPFTCLTSLHLQS